MVSKFTISENGKEIDIWDMTGSPNGKYTARSLAKDDVVLLSKTKGYRVGKLFNWLRLTQPELNSYFKKIKSSENLNSSENEQPTGKESS